jgi:SPP1 gp7 family putative phage head morphogenesis protein
LKKIKQKADAFLYEMGVNVALDAAERKRLFKKWRAGIGEAIRWQIKEITREDRFERLLQVSKLEKYRVKPSENQQMTVVLRALFDDLDLETAFVTQTGESLEIYFKWGANLGGQAAIDKLGIIATFGVANPEWLKFLENAKNLMITSVDQTTKEWIAGMLAEGIENQLTNDEMRDLLLTEVKGMSEVRGDMIVRTELANVMNKTELESYKRSGVETKMWRNSRDERVCEICQPLDNEKVKVGQNFSIGLDGPPAHVQCRCFLQAVEDAWWQPKEGEIWTGE